MGSYFNTEHDPVVPVAKIVADFNMDMIGRSQGGGEPYVNPETQDRTSDPDSVYIVGDDKHSSELRAISERANAETARLRLDYTYTTSVTRAAPTTAATLTTTPGAASPSSGTSPAGTPITTRPPTTSTNSTSRRWSGSAASPTRRAGGWPTWSAACPWTGTGPESFRAPCDKVSPSGSITRPAPRPKEKTDARA